MSDTIFGRIIRGEVEAEVLYQDEFCMAIKDVAPAAPFHALVIPRKPIAKLADAQAEDGELLGRLLLAGARLAREHGHGEGFRLVVNNGVAGGQTVFHLHIHVLAGRPLAWPPG